MKALLVVPFWRRPNHLSAVRAERFIRWLNADGWEVVLVRAGESDKSYEQHWGMEVSVRDPLGLHPEEQSSAVLQSGKEYSPFVMWAAALLFNPDPGILWSRRVAGHPLVLQHGQGADFVLSSSPPESAHLCAATLAKQLTAKLVIDMRDGWLDEPLKQSLQKSGLQRTREGRLERRVLSQANKIFVTSKGWKELLVKRLPFCEEKTVVLTNSLPRDDMKEPVLPDGDQLTLLYAGKLTLSRSTQRASLLLAPLLSGVRTAGQSGCVEFMGDMAQTDLEEIAIWTPRFAEAGWRIVVSPAVTQAEARTKIAQAHGLLLLCEVHAAMPAKLYEYIAACKPVMSVAPCGSSVEFAVANLPQFFHLDSTQAVEGESEVARDFLRACALKEGGYPLPEEYSEERLSKVFINHVY